MPSPLRGVLCAGTIVVDVVKVIDAYPELEHLATIEQVTLSTGGPGLNMAVDLACSATAFPRRHARRGRRRPARRGSSWAECARLGIDTTGVRTGRGVVTSFTDAMVERDGGRRTFFHHRGANDLFDASVADLAGSGARILHAGAPGVHRLMDAPTPGGGNGWSDAAARGPGPPGCTPIWNWSTCAASGWPRWPRPACRTWTAS